MECEKLDRLIKNGSEKKGGRGRGRKGPKERGRLDMGGRKRRLNR